MTDFPRPTIHGHAGDESRRGVENATGVAKPVTPVATYVPVRALEDMLAVRTDQIFKYGHTAEKDAARALSHFVRDIADATRAIGEDMQFNKGPDRMRRRLVKLGALILATIDRIDNEGGAQ